MRRCWLLSGLLILCLLARFADAQQSGVDALARGDDQAAFRDFLGAAEKGDIAAARTVGSMYLSGMGTKQDFASARSWLEKAAAAGDAIAEFNLGTMAGDGLGAESNPAAAADWFTKAADQGNPNAENALGLLYYEGRGRAKDDLAAWQWFLAGAKQDFPLAAFNLGALYDNGIAASANDTRFDGFFRELGGDRPANLSGNQIEKVQTVNLIIRNEAARWYRKAAEQGLALAQVGLGELYRTGQGVPQDYAQAVAWFERAAAGTEGASATTGAPDN